MYLLLWNLLVLIVFTIFAWGHAHLLLKEPGEMLLGRKAVFKGYLLKGALGVEQLTFHGLSFFLIDDL